MDATLGYENTLARMCNDERKRPNAVMRKVEKDGEVYLCLFALRDLHPEYEIRYDYGPNKSGSMPCRKVSIYHYSGCSVSHGSTICSVLCGNVCHISTVSECAVF